MKCYISHYPGCFNRSEQSHRCNKSGVRIAGTDRCNNLSTKDSLTSTLSAFPRNAVFGCQSITSVTNYWLLASSAIINLRRSGVTNFDSPVLSACEKASDKNEKNISCGVPWSSGSFSSCSIHTLFKSWYVFGWMVRTWTSSSRFGLSVPVVGYLESALAAWYLLPVLYNMRELNWESRNHHCTNFPELSEVFSSHSRASCWNIWI